MASYFLDSSALAKLYVKESGSATMVALATSEESHSLAVLSVARVELRSALRRRQRAGDITVEECDGILERFVRHFEMRYERVSLNDPLIEGACALVDRHALRAYDALQLAGCLEWKRQGVTGLTFVCSDKALLVAAQAEGLPTLDPALEGKKDR